MEEGTAIWRDFVLVCMLLPADHLIHVGRLLRKSTHDFASRVRCYEANA